MGEEGLADQVEAVDGTGIAAVGHTGVGFEDTVAGLRRV